MAALISIAPEEKGALSAKRGLDCDRSNHSRWRLKPVNQSVNASHVIGKIPSGAQKTPPCRRKLDTCPAGRSSLAAGRCYSKTRILNDHAIFRSSTQQDSGPR